MAYASASAPAALPGLGRIALASTGEARARSASFDVTADRAAFNALEAEWNDLFQRAGKSTQLELAWPRRARRTPQHTPSPP
jgi:hypothetical protein